MVSSTALARLRLEAPLQLGRGPTDLDELLHYTPPTLAVVDGITEAMALHNVDPTDNVDVARFNGYWSNPWSTPAPPSSALTMWSKGRRRRRYALGGAHKLDAVTGAHPAC